MAPGSTQRCPAKGQATTATNCKGKWSLGAITQHTFPGSAGAGLREALETLTLEALELAWARLLAT